MYLNLSEVGVILNKENVEKKLSYDNKLDAYKRYEFGLYYEPETVNNVIVQERNVFIEKNGRKFIRLDDGVHIGKPIKWIILDCQMGKVRMITEKTIAKIPGRDIDTWLNDYFRRIAFSDAESKVSVTIYSAAFLAANCQ